jgi:uncharacterized protein YjbJ (UPF0337 family)
MDENRVKGAARSFGGQLEAEAASVTGDAQGQLKGKVDQVAGTAQNLYRQAADAARERAGSFDEWLRETIETKPYAAALVALGVGWLLGRMHRPY